MVLPLHHYAAIVLFRQTELHEVLHTTPHAVVYYASIIPLGMWGGGDTREGYHHLQRSLVTTQPCATALIWSIKDLHLRITLATLRHAYSRISVLGGDSGVNTNSANGKCTCDTLNNRGSHHMCSESWGGMTLAFLLPNRVHLYLPLRIAFS